MPAQRVSSRIQNDTTKLLVRGQSTSGLLKKLQILQDELSQDRDLDDFKEVHTQLCSPDLTLHKDKAVRASVACCLADVLRLSAPNAPFDDNDLQDILQFFLIELCSPKSGLSDPNGPQYSDYVYLLESLDKAKAIALLTDLPKADEMMVEWFKKIFDLIRPDMPRNVEVSLAQILEQLILECHTPPSEVLEILLANFSTKASKMNPAAHRLTIQVCSTTNERLQGHVTQYFSEAIVSASSEEEHDEREKELKSLHSLITMINRSVPSLLLNVVAVLEQELSAEDVLVRQIATRTLGHMLGEKASPSLAANYPSTWKAWLSRAHDKMAGLRVLWVDSTTGLLVNHPELRREMTTALTTKLHDPDERVRTTVAKVIGALDYETVLHHLDRRFLQAVGDRLRDRRPSVREETQECLGRLYNLAYPAIENHDPAATEHFGWIPNAMVNSVFTDAKSTVPLIASMEKYILPLPTRSEDEGTWINRLLMVMKHLDDTGTKALFLTLNNMRSAHSRKPYLPFIESCEAFGGGVLGDKDTDTLARLKASLRGSITSMPDASKAAADLSTFANMNDSRIYRLFRACLDPTTDLKTYIKARSEALRRIEAADAKLLPTLTAFLRLASYPFVNRNTIPTLLKRISQSKSQWRESQIGVANSQQQAESSANVNSQSQAIPLADLPDMDAFKICASRTLDLISKHCPEMFQPHVSELIRSLSEDTSTLLLQSALKALCAVKQSGRNVTLDKRVIDRVVRSATRGTPLQAKYAARLLAISSDNATAVRAVEETLSELSARLSQNVPSRLVSDLSALGQFFKHAPKASENVWDAVLKDVLKDLSKPWPAGAAESYDQDEDWVEDDKMEDAVKAKLLGMDVLCKRATAGSSSSSDKASDMSVPVFRLMFKTLENGEPRDLGTPNPVKSRLRLQAALCILKMALLPACDKAIQRDFGTLSLVTQDPAFQVRSRFLHKLLLYINAAGGKKRLSTRYHAIPFVAAIDPEEENRDMVRTWAAQARMLPSEERLKRLELSLCRYVHLLAQHPDFGRDSAETVREFVPYIQFYLDCAATEQNIGLLFYLAGRLKTVRDGASQGASENLYALSELTQLVIKHRAAKHNWRLEQFPGSFKVPSDTGLKALPSSQAQKEIYETVWLPAAVTQALENDIAKVEKRRAEPGSGPRRAPAEREHKRKLPQEGSSEKPKKSKPAKRPRKSKDDDDGNDDDEDEEDDIEDSEDDADARDVSSDEAISSGEEEGRGARAKAQARERNRKRAERRTAQEAATKDKEKQKAGRSSTKGAAVANDDDDGSELSDVD
ncbi:unnamed protein product [Sympodiomycopsis kandeliae]